MSAGGGAAPGSQSLAEAEAVAVAVAVEVLGPSAVLDAPLGARTTYRVGGRAAALVEVADEADLDRVTHARQRAGDALAVLVVGFGSNLLVAEAGFPGLVVVLGPAFAEVDLAGADSGEVVAGGATALPVLARQSARAGLRGLEWAVGIPGSVGGAVRMNAGGHGADVAATLRWVRVRDLATGNDGRMPAGQLALGYRRSGLGPDDVVLGASFGLVPGDPEDALAEVDEVVHWRRAHQPGGRNAGSVFANPPEDAAGRLIEAAGAKGLRIGTAQVSDKHANFFQVDVDGSADDVRSLMEEVARRVEATSGVRLVPEVRMVGFGDRWAPGR